MSPLRMWLIPALYTPLSSASYISECTRSISLAQVGGVRVECPCSSVSISAEALVVGTPIRAKALDRILTIVQESFETTVLVVLSHKTGTVRRVVTFGRS